MNYFLYITHITGFLPLLVFLFNLKENRNKPIRVIIYYIVYSLINEGILAFLRSEVYKGGKEIEAIIVASFTILEYFFFALFLYLSLNNNRNKKALQLGSIIFGISAILNLYSNLHSSSKIEVFDTLTVSISAISLIVFCLVFLFEKIQKPEIGFIYAKKSFWIVIGIMIYFSGTFFLFLQYSELSEKEQENFWIINWFCIIIKNIFFAIAFYLQEENLNSIPDNESDLFSLNDLD